MHIKEEAKYINNIRHGWDGHRSTSEFDSLRVAVCDAIGTISSAVCQGINYTRVNITVDTESSGPSCVCEMRYLRESDTISVDWMERHPLIIMPTESDDCVKVKVTVV